MYNHLNNQVKELGIEFIDEIYPKFNELMRYGYPNNFTKTNLNNALELFDPLTEDVDYDLQSIIEMLPGKKSNSNNN